MAFSYVEFWREFAVTVSLTLIAAAAGTTVGWTSPTIPVLLAEDSPIPTTPDQSSWIASLMILFSTLSPLPAAFLVDKIGRKATLLIAGIPYIIGWVIIMLANNVGMIYASRMMSGIGYGIAYTSAPIYIGEIASDGIRGSMATLITVMSKFGILLQYCVGPFVSITGLAAVNITIPILFLATFVFAPESPYFYLRHKNKKKAKQALVQLRGYEDVEDILNTMETHVNETMKNKGKWVDLVKVKGNRRALIVLLGICTVQQFCGSMAVISYCQQIFSQTLPVLSPSSSCILFGTVQLCTSAISSLLVDKLGRRPLLLFSTVGLALTNLVIGTYFYLEYHHSTYLDYLSLVPVIVLLVYIFSYNIGLASVPFAIISEFFPTNVKSFATCILQIYTALSTFAVTKLYQVVADNLGTYVAFWSFAGFSIAGVIFIVLLLPETKGLSFTAIQMELNKGELQKNDIKLNHHEQKKSDII